MIRTLGIVVLVALAACSSGGGGGDEAGSSGDGDEFALPLIGEPPEGLGRDVLGPALEAAAEGLGYDYEAGAPVALPLPSQVLIRPGVQIIPESIFPGWCTAAFVFDDRSKISTAGHCTAPGDAVLAIALPSTIFVIGHTSSSTGADSELGNDWALIDIAPEWRPFVDPAVAFVGGPCGRASDGFPPLLKYIGHGILGVPRIGLYVGMEEGAFRALGPSNAGDSGGPVLEHTQAGASGLCLAGGAVGILTHQEFFVTAGVTLVPTGAFLGTPISRIGNSLDDGALLP
jgi:hypothetical protein